MTYPCTGNEPIFNDIEIYNPDGSLLSIAVASECFANWYVSTFGGWWRHTPPPEPPDGEE